MSWHEENRTGVRKQACSCNVSCIMCKCNLQHPPWRSKMVARMSPSTALLSEPPWSMTSTLPAPRSRAAACSRRLELTHLMVATGPQNTRRPP